MIAKYVSVFTLAFAATYFLIEEWKRRKNSRPKYPQYPPSLPSLPLVGSLPFIRNFDNIPEFFMEKARQLGPLFTFRVGSKLILTLNDTETIREALVKKSRSFSSRPEIFLQKLVNPNNRGIVFMDTGDEWKQIHQSSLSVLKEFGFGDKNIMEERILREVDAMIDVATKKNGKPFNPKELSFLMSSNIMMNILFGFRNSYDLGISALILEADQYARDTDMSFDMAPFLRFIPRFRDKIVRIKNCCAKLHSYIDTEIDKSLQSGKRCFVSEYMKQEGDHYDQEQLNFMLRDMIIAGTDTTAYTFQWCLVALANRPDIQKRLQEEIDAVIPKERSPTLRDQPKLTYLEATTLELFRWRTLVPISVPRFTRCDSVLRDCFIPAGTLVLPNIHAAHFDPKVWKDPDEFRPERFLDKENNIVGRHRIIPFSIGRRSCLGEILARAEIFLIVTSLLQRFDVLPPENQDRLCDQPFLPMGMAMVPRPFSVRLLERRHVTQ